ncbi:MAG TPA: GIY-YIG nuclease family protein [Patescibacteria group bacterium]|nr:GIY-YIG nuclease family protein [Patescibacteria group bacterium]
MEWYIYILLCDQKIFYVGLTSNIKLRFKSHQNKYNFATKKFNEIELVYKESYKTRFEAERREKQLKDWSRAKKTALIKGEISLLKKLSKSRSMPNK